MLATTTTTTTMYHVPPTEAADTQARTSADTNSASDTFTFTDTFTDTDASTATYDGSQRRSPKLPVRSTAFEMRKMLFWRPIQLELVASNCERDCATNITAMSADADADAETETEANANAATSINQQVKLYCRSTTFRCAPAKVFDFRGPNAGAIRIRTKPEKMEISVAFTTRLHKLRLRTDSPEEYEKWFYLFIRSDSNLVMEIPPHLAIKTDTKAEAHQHSVTQVHRTVTFNDNVDVRYIQYQDQHVQDIQDVQESEHDAVGADADADAVHGEMNGDDQADGRFSMCWSLADSFEADLCNAFTATSALVVEDARTETNADADDDERTVSQSDSASPSSRSLPPSLLFPEGGLELADDAEDYRGHGDQWVPSSDAWTAYLIESDEDYQATRASQHRESSLWSLDHLVPSPRATWWAAFHEAVAAAADDNNYREEEEEEDDRSHQGILPTRVPPDESQRSISDAGGSIAKSPFQRLQLRLRAQDAQDATSRRRTPAIGRRRQYSQDRHDRRHHGSVDHEQPSVQDDRIW